MADKILKDLLEILERWFWVILCSLIILLIKSNSGYSAIPMRSELSVSKIRVDNTELVSQRNDSIPSVDIERLFSHIEALSFERYSDSERTQARNYISQQLTEIGWSIILQPFEEGINLIAKPPDIDPEVETILVSAHYDTVEGSPGADDNASGVAVVLELARLFGSRTTSQALQVAFFDKEEDGLLGSTSFVSDEKNIINLRGVVNIDMVGFACYTNGCQSYPSELPSVVSDIDDPLPNISGNFLAVAGDFEHPYIINAFQESNQIDSPPIMTISVPLKGLLAPDLMRGDHTPFWLKNIGAVMVTDTAELRNNNYHKNSDIPETLDRDFLSGSAQHIMNVVSRLLESEEF